MIAALLLAAAAAGAHPCAADAQKFCQGIAPGGGRILACLKSHEGELSAGCKEKRADFKEQVQDAVQACQDDAQKLCASVKPGHGRMIKCLKKRQSELSAPCAAALTQQP